MPFAFPSSRLRVSFVMRAGPPPPGEGNDRLTCASRSYRPPPLTSVAVVVPFVVRNVIANCLEVFTASSFQVSCPLFTFCWSDSACQRVRSGNMPGKTTCTKVPAVSMPGLRTVTNACNEGLLSKLPQLTLSTFWPACTPTMGFQCVGFITALGQDCGPKPVHAGIEVVVFAALATPLPARVIPKPPLPQAVRVMTSNTRTSALIRRRLKCFTDTKRFFILFLQYERGA